MFALEVPELVLILGLVIAGIGEGVVLGHSQSRVVSQLFPEVSGWTAATATAAGLAWLAGMGGSALVQIEPTWLVVVVPGWIVALLSMGYLQASRLASAADDAYDWVGVTTAGWLVGVALPVVALSVMPNDWPLLLHVVAAVVAAVATGATVGAVSAPTLYRLAGTETDEVILH